MSILSKMTTELKYRIPIQILTAAFNNYNENGWRTAPVSLDELIISKVIRPRVIMDANIVGGETVLVPISGSTTIEYADEFTRVIKIDPADINHRTVMTVLSAHYQPYGHSMNSIDGAVGSSGLGFGSTNDVNNAAMRANNSFSSVPILSTATVQLVGYNTILVRDRAYIANIYGVRCVLAHEENLENINIRSWHVFSRMAELAVKSYIYNTMIIQMDKAYLSGGQELGVFTEIVNSYADSEELYQNILKEKIQKVSYMNDSIEYARYIRTMINPGI